LDAGIIRAANIAVDRVVENVSNANRVKSHQWFLAADGTQNSSLFVDGTHLSPAGYQIWEKQIKLEFSRCGAL